MRSLFLLCLLAFSLYAAPLRSKIDHIVVIYLENRSFDNLFRGFKGADNSKKPLKPYALQSDENGTLYKTLQMGEDARAAGFPTFVKNQPFLLDTFIPQDGVIPDLIHRFYQNQLQINGGKNDRFVLWSDQKAMVMGYHDIHKSALWRYAKSYTLCDRFFTGAFGGSFLNHQWLIAARTPFVGKESNISSYKLDDEGKVLQDGILTPDGYAVNTIQPYYPPYDQKSSDASKRLRPLTYDTIGDRLSEKHISWAWYSGGYDDAQRGKGEDIFYQYHHNPFLYFERYRPNSQGRKHLKDEKDFFYALHVSKLPQIVFFKPSAFDNEHPGYGTIQAADKKIEEIVETIRSKPKIWNSCVIIITYDENGGLWDHVAPPKVDRWGPGTRIPAVIISPFAKKGFIDHTLYDTTSILSFIEWRYGLKPVGVRKSNNILSAFEK